MRDLSLCRLNAKRLRLMLLVFCGFLLFFCLFFFSVLKGAAEIKAGGPRRDPLFSLLKFLIRNSGVPAAGREPPWVSVSWWMSRSSVGLLGGES